MSQVVSMAAAPVLSRIYGPSDYGVLAVFASVVGLLAVLSTLRYELAIPLPSTSSEAATLVRLCLVLVMSGAALTFMVWSVWGGTLAAVFGVPKLSGYAPILALGVLLAGTYATFSSWAVRCHSYALLARTRLVQSISGVAVSLALGFMGVAPAGLLLGSVANSAAGSSTLARRFRSSKGLERRAGGTSPTIVSCAKRYRRFPLYTTWQAVLNAASQYAPPVVFSGVFGAAVAGQYGLAMRLCILPVAVVGQSMSQVFFGEAATVKSDRDALAALTEQAAGRMVAISLPVFGVLLAFGPALFASVLGARWTTAGLYCQILAPRLAVATVSTSLSFLPMVLERQAAAAVYAVFEAALALAALAVAIVTQIPVLGVAAISSAGTACNLYYLLWCLRLAGVSIRRFVIQSALCAAGCSIPILAAIAMTVGRGAWCGLAGAVVAGIIGLGFSGAVYERLARRRESASRMDMPAQDASDGSHG